MRYTTLKLADRESKLEITLVKRLAVCEGLNGLQNCSYAYANETMEHISNS